MQDERSIVVRTERTAWWNPLRWNWFTYDMPAKFAHGQKGIVRMQQRGPFYKVLRIIEDGE